MKNFFMKSQYYQKQSIDLIQYNPHQNNSDILHKRRKILKFIREHEGPHSNLKQEQCQKHDHTRW